MRRQLATVVLLMAMVRPLAGQQVGSFNDYDISFGVSGDAGPDDSFNPISAVYKRWPKYGTRVLGFINYVHPRAPDEIVVASGLPDTLVNAILASLDTCGLIRRDSSGFHVTFAVFDDDVWAAFEPAMASMAQAMSDRISSEILPRLAGEFPRTQLSRRGFPLEVVAPVIVGAFGLDERAIEELEQRELIRIRTQHPGGRWYAVLAQRNRSAKVRGGLWGIHGMGQRGVFFGTFGDNGPMNYRRREIKTLPDLAWNWGTTGSLPSAQIDHLVTTLGHVVVRAETDYFVDSTVADSDGRWLRPLARAGLLETADSTRYRVSFPVFGSDDWRWTKTVIAQLATIAVAAVGAAGQELARAYGKTAPASNGVPLREVLNYVYHDTYTRVMRSWFADHPEMRFAFEDGTLRYTGYAVVR